MKISEFKIGELITRREPAKSIQDRSGIGEKFIFRGYDEPSGKIYLERTKDEYGIIKKGDICEWYTADQYLEGWAYYPTGYPKCTKFEAFFIWTLPMYKRYLHLWWRRFVLLLKKIIPFS